MASTNWYKRVLTCSLVLGGLIYLFSLRGSAPTLAQTGTAFVRQVRAMEADETGIPNPAGLAFSPRAKAFHVVEARVQGQPTPADTDIIKLTSYADRVGSARIAAAIKDPINMAFDEKANRLLIYQAPADRLIEVLEGPDGNLDPTTLVRHDARHFGLQNPQGMTVDPASGHLFILDSVGPRIVRIEPDADQDFDNATISELDLQSTGLADPRGIAFDPTSGHVYLLSPAERRLYELTEAGQVVATRDLSEFELSDPQSMVFAPSGDLTDDASLMNLYIADSGLSGRQNQRETSGESGQIVELSFTQPVLIQAAAPASLIQTIDTSQFSPPSPDPAGIAYLEPSNTLLVSDSEVNEMDIFADANLFATTLSGTLVYTASTISFSDEPTGVAFNPSNEHLFFSDDVGPRGVYELDPGVDGLYHTLDDIITYISSSAFGCYDAEGITFDSWQGALFIADGMNNEVYQVSPGANGIFDGVPPAGDDQVTNFDTGSVGITDPEGIEFNSDSGTLYIVGKPSDSLAEVTTGGSLVQMIDISAAGGENLAGLAYAPGSLDPTVMNIYIADRGIDNDSDPEENDGKVYEMSLPSPTPDNTPPTVSISAPSVGATFIEGETITFSGSASDAEDGDLTVDLAWTSDLDISIGSGGTFTRSDLSVGTHTITAWVTDSGGLAGSDEITMTVNANPAPSVSITAPSDGATYAEGQSITFVGSASDAEDGDLSDSLAWTSDLNGSIGSSGSFTTSSLSIGMHTITAVVTDSSGLSGSDEITMTVNANTAPSVSITAPTDGATYVEGESITFSGSASDEDGDLSENLAWTSDLDGSIGSGGTFTRSDLSVGAHTITAMVTDSGGLSSSDEITMTVNTNTPPTASITAPSDGATYVEGESITFTGSASDAEEGDLSGGLNWTSDLAGSIGSGGTFTRSDLSVGAHTITAMVTDSGGLSGSDAITITVNTNGGAYVLGDFDGDGDSDVGVYRPAAGRWFIQGQPIVPFGASSDIPAPGDYDGDGDADIALYRPAAGRWFILGMPMATYGTNGDIPVPGDYDGDGDTDIALYRPAAGRWFILGQPLITYGGSSDIPVPGDYDGDGDTDAAVYRPSVGRWFILGQPMVTFGASGDIPAPGDYDGDGDMDIALYRPTAGRWFILGQPLITFGGSSDIPVPGDYDGDGDTDIALFRPSSGRWFILGQPPVTYGASGDIPVEKRPSYPGYPY